MKKTILLSQTFLLAILLASGITFLYSCQKRPETPLPTTSSPFEALRLAFNAAGYEQALTQPFGDSSKLYWELNWHATYTKAATSGQVYAYVPLTPSLRSLRPRQGNTEFHMIGTQRFIIAKLVGDNYYFNLATYTVAKPKTTQATAKRQTFAEAAAQRVLSPSFSGNLVLQGLTLKEHALFSYQNGVLVGQQNQLAAPKGNEASATNSYDCITWGGLDVRSQGVMAYLSTVASSKNYGTSTSRQRPHNSGSTTQYPT